MEFIDLHPRLVHFPLTMFILGSLIFILWYFTHNRFLFKACLGMLGAGIFLSFLALLTGNIAATNFMDANPVAASPALKQEITAMIESHQSFATYTIVCYTILFTGLFFSFTRERRKLPLPYPAVVRTLMLILACAGLYFIYETGNLGGYLVYKYGVGTDLLMKQSLLK